MGTLNSWASSPHIGAHNIPSPSQRGTTHPSHGNTQLMGFLIGRLTSVYVLEDVSCSCNHQHSLSARETFSIRPSPAWKYLIFILVVVINTPSQLGRYSLPSQSLTEVLELHLGKRFGENIYNPLMCRKVLHVYYFPLHHVSDIMIFYLNVFRSIMKHRVLRELHTTLVITMNNNSIHLIIK
jgi:hypothetical protein